MLVAAAAKVARPARRPAPRSPVRTHCSRPSPGGGRGGGPGAAVFAAAGLLIDAGRARLCAGQAYAAAGLGGEARTELAAAAQTFSDCGARSLHAATVREQRRLGVRVPGVAGRAAGPHGLTQRELEVVKLVRDGCTNQQIAESLFVSIRTVETHLSHVFTKLGVTSRTALLKALSES